VKRLVVKLRELGVFVVGIAYSQPVLAIVGKSLPGFIESKLWTKQEESVERVLVIRGEKRGDDRT